MLETEEALVTKIVRCPSLTHNDYVFDADTVFPIGIVARFCALLVNPGVLQGKVGGNPYRLKLSYPALMGCYCMLRNKYSACE